MSVVTLLGVKPTAALVAGCVIGAWAYPRINLAAIWFAAAVAFALSAVLAVTARRKD